MGYCLSATWKLVQLTVSRFLPTRSCPYLLFLDRQLKGCHLRRQIASECFQRSLLRINWSFSATLSFSKAGKWVHALPSARGTQCIPSSYSNRCAALSRLAQTPRRPSPQW